jgi:putative PIN family toxin of toxin-antitoxin system
MNIVIDANIFISSFIGKGNPRTVVDRVADTKDTLFITDEILAEVDSVFRKRKFHLTEEIIQYRMTRIKRIGTKIKVAASERITDGGCRDTTANKYLACAVAAKADYVISGDIHLRELKEYRGIKIVNPAEYLEIVNE